MASRHPTFGRRKAERRRRRRLMALCVLFVVAAATVLIAVSRAGDLRPAATQQPATRSPADPASVTEGPSGRSARRPDPQRRTVRIRSALFQQAQRNSCEPAALSILLSTVGPTVDQQALQAEIPRSGPLDPRETPAGRVWGDPRLGYVGRSDGGGVAGGFGVYERPIQALARRHDVILRDLSHGPVTRVYRSLRSRRAVMVWVGLSAGPYGQWRTPRGRTVHANYGEHTVVLTGMRGRDGAVFVANPLNGTREVWSRRHFQVMWNRLARRALGTSTKERQP